MVRFLLLESITWNFAQKFLWFETDLTSSKLLKQAYKFTLKSSFPYSNFHFSDSKKSFFNKTFKPNVKLKRSLKNAQFLHRDVYDYLNRSNESFNIKFFLRTIVNYKKFSSPKLYFINKLDKKFNLIFFKKEKIYTKLKYSRVPQYDAVSGGSAAILAGFLGYLITEKFGLELVDSGDFWFFFMYCVFLGFSCQPLLKIILDAPFHWSVMSYKWGFFFYTSILNLLFKSFMAIVKNFFSFIYKFFL